MKSKFLFFWCAVAARACATPALAQKYPDRKAE
jgi:hypothetical protein